MKVLFAVNNEEISESIKKLYQKEYREIISSKNVYYFNAIVKELQRDQTYDRVIISEDLEPYSNNKFDVIDKFLFEQLDKISDEAISNGGADIPIIFIASDRRSKSDNLLSKLFSIGVYDALLGQDRSIPEVCKLLNKPRTKKEAKIYYKIESDEVTYQAESEDSVSETEIQNILTHYKKLGKNTERYVESFNNIAAQYTDTQLRIITKFLPIGVKAVLEQESPKYQSIMTFGEGTYKDPQSQKQAEKKKDDLKIDFIESKNNKQKLTKPVVIPSEVNKEQVKKLNKQEPVQTQPAPTQPTPTQTDEAPAAPKRRGRPKKVVVTADTTPLTANANTASETAAPAAPKRRGRPRKNPLPETVPAPTPEPVPTPVQTEQEDVMLPGFDAPEPEPVQQTPEPVQEDTILPGFDDEPQDSPAVPEPEPEMNNVRPNTPPMGFGGRNTRRYSRWNETRYARGYGTRRIWTKRNEP